MDHKAFIYSDAGMKEWYDRYLTIYEHGAGYPDDVSEAELRGLSERYGFGYAVLPAGADMPFRGACGVGGVEAGGGAVIRGGAVSCRRRVCPISIFPSRLGKRIRE